MVSFVPKQNKTASCSHFLSTSWPLCKGVLSLLQKMNSYLAEKSLKVDLMQECVKAKGLQWLLSKYSYRKGQGGGRVVKMVAPCSWVLDLIPSTTKSFLGKPAITVCLPGLSLLKNNKITECRKAVASETGGPWQAWAKLSLAIWFFKVIET